jgi:hypothetical protein
MKAMLLVMLSLAALPGRSQEVPNCGRVAEMAAALRAEDTQLFQDLSAKASSLEIHAARIREKAALTRLGPREVRDGILRACVEAAR